MCAASSDWSDLEFTNPYMAISSGLQDWLKCAGDKFSISMYSTATVVFRYFIESTKKLKGYGKFSKVTFTHFAQWHSLCVLPR